jgi:hypothetical protein
MSRRSDRNGICRGEIQRRINVAHWREMERRGLPAYARFTIGEGFSALGLAAWNRRSRLYILRRHLSPYERAMYLRDARLALVAAKYCDRPRLP